MTIRIGFYGAGLISTMHGAFLSASSVPNTVTAVHDPDEVRARSFAERHGAVVADELGLLDLVDAVYVTTWTSEHAHLVALAAERGLPVFCEKPLAVDSVSVEEMVDTVERAGVVNQVGLLLRFSPHFIMARDLIRDPAAGRLLAVAFRDDQYIPNQGRYASTWRTDPARAGRGALLEHSVHDVDVLRWLGGEISTVSAAMREVHGYPLIDDVAAVRFDFHSGALATLTSVWHDILERPSMRHVEVFCERLHVVIDDEFAGSLRWQFTGAPPQELDAAGVAGACIESGSTVAEALVPFLGGAVVNPASAFLAAVAEGRPSPVPFREALVSHRLVDSIYRSADAGGVLVAHAESRPPDGAERAADRPRSTREGAR